MVHTQRLTHPGEKKKKKKHYWLTTDLWWAVNACWLFKQDAAEFNASSLVRDVCHLWHCQLLVKTLGFATLWQSNWTTGQPRICSLCLSFSIADIPLPASIVIRCTEHMFFTLFPRTYRYPAKVDCNRIHHLRLLRLATTRAKTVAIDSARSNLCHPENNRAVQKKICTAPYGY